MKNIKFKLKIIFFSSNLSRIVEKTQKPKFPHRDINTSQIMAKEQAEQDRLTEQDRLNAERALKQAQDEAAAAKSETNAAKYEFYRAKREHATAETKSKNELNELKFTSHLDLLFQKSLVCRKRKFYPS